jgi:hypothetical protein
MATEERSPLEEEEITYSADHLVQDPGDSGLTDHGRYLTFCNKLVTSLPEIVTAGNYHYTLAEVESEVERFGTILCEKCSEVRCLVTLKDAVL